jgi:hypothetical protein
MMKIHGFRGIAVATALALASCHGTEATYSIGGSISGTTGTVVLKLNGGDDIVLNGDGSFKFDQKLLKDDTFNVQVIDANDRCTVSNGAGVVGQSNITDVSIGCVAQSAQNFTLAAIRSANLSGAQENPPVTTNATGAGGVILAPASLAITGGVSLSGLTPLAGQIQIHQAPSGNPAGNGPAIVNLILAADGLTAVVPPGTVLTLNQLASLLAGELYFNVATAANLNGEIRGAIELQGGVAASVAALDQSQVVPPTGSAAAGTGTILANLATGKVLIAYVTHNVANTTASAIHASTGAGTNGASVVPFTNLQTNFDGAGANLATPPATALLAAQNLADFAAHLLYFEVDSQANPNGEIRGNISPQ